MAKQQFHDLDMQSANRLTNLPSATQAGHAVEYAQFLAANEGQAWKDSVRVAAPANINLSSPGTTIDGITMATGDRFLAPNETSQPTNGIYIFNGSATPATRSLDANTFDELEAAFVAVEEGTSAGSVYRQTQVNGTIGTTNVIWVIAFSNAPPASESTAGIAAIATQAEVDAGTNDNKIVTPLKLAASANRKRKAVGTIGDGSATTGTINHNFNTYDVQVEFYKTGGNRDTVNLEVTRPSLNSITWTANPAPASGAISFVILA